MKKKSKEKLSARAKLVMWIKREIAREPSFKIPDIVERAHQRLGRDAGFINEYARSAIRRCYYDDIRLVVAESRAAAIGGAYVHLDRLEEATDVAAKSLWGRWNTCFEYVGDRHVAVFEMTDVEINAAESLRFTSAEEHERWGRFFHSLRPGMKKGKKVRDCFSVQQLNDLWDKAVAAGDTQKGAA